MDDAQAGAPGNARRDAESDHAFQKGRLAFPHPVADLHAGLAGSRLRIGQSPGWKPVFAKLRNADRAPDFLRRGIQLIFQLYCFFAAFFLPVVHGSISFSMGLSASLRSVLYARYLASQLAMRVSPFGSTS